MESKYKNGDVLETNFRFVDKSHAFSGRKATVCGVTLNEDGTHSYNLRLGEARDEMIVSGRNFLAFHQMFLSSDSSPARR